MNFFIYEEWDFGPKVQKKSSKKKHPVKRFFRPPKFKKKKKFKNSAQFWGGQFLGAQKKIEKKIGLESSLKFTNRRISQSRALFIPYLFQLLQYFLFFTHFWIEKLLNNYSLTLNFWVQKKTYDEEWDLGPKVQKKSSKKKTPGEEIFRTPKVQKKKFKKKNSTVLNIMYIYIYNVTIMSIYIIWFCVYTYIMLRNYL